MYHIRRFEPARKFYPSRLLAVINFFVETVTIPLSMAFPAVVQTPASKMPPKKEIIVYG